MYWFRIEQTLQPTEREPAAGECAAVLLSSAELERKPALSGLESVLHHTPAARDVRVCKAELRRDCVSGTLLIPQAWKGGSALACGYLITNNRVVLVDDTGALLSHLRHIAKEKRWTDGSTGRFVYAFLEQLLAKDLHHLEEIEDRIEELEERVLAGELENFNAPMAELRKETMTLFRYYTQLDDVAFTLRENELGIFSEREQMLFRMFADRVIRLREESQLLREYCSQVQNLFQSEIDTKQNRIMQILTIVTTVFLPLSLLAGWYGMNFTGMPELNWKYGYPVIIAVSVIVVALSLWICRKKKFW